MKSIKAPIFLTAFLCFLANCPVFISAKTPSNLLLSPSAMIPNDPVYYKILDEKMKGEVSEDLKIAYLISRLQNSPYTFIRNGYSYSGRRAAAHIRHKYQKKANLVRSALDFIKRIASRSSTSGKSYLMKIGGQKSYEIRDILTNELNLLEESLRTVQSAPEPLKVPARGDLKITS